MTASAACSREEFEKAIAAIAARMKQQAACQNPKTSAATIPAAPIDKGASRSSQEIHLNPAVHALAGVIDHTQLRPEATRQKIELLCDEALYWNLGAVCVNPAWISLAASRLQASRLKLATVCGFPFGATLVSAKQAEAEAAIAAGASEIDMVMNVGAMKSGDYALVEADIGGVTGLCHQAKATVKVILENSYLTEAEKREACRIAQRAGADFVKTSTGFGPSGATEADVHLMRETVGWAMGVKAAGGIRSLSDAVRMLQAGASRLGSSAGHSIVAEAARLWE
jgi:deoxyribose-phosphate aldolase